MVTVSVARPYSAHWLNVLYRWKLNDTFISSWPGSRYSISGGNLRISRLSKEEDVGIYQCLASNSFGTTLSREASLHIACEFYFSLYLSVQSYCDLAHDDAMLRAWRVAVLVAFGDFGDVLPLSTFCISVLH